MTADRIDGPGSPDRNELARLVRRLSEAEGALQALTGNELDAVVDPSSATPILIGRAREAIAKSEARYRDLVNRCPALVCEISADGNIAFANEAVRGVLGYDPREVIGTPLWSRLVAPDNLAQARQLVAAMRRGDVTAFELALRARSGATRWILWNTSNRYSDDGRMTMGVAFGIDITARKEAEETAARLNEAQVARAQAEASNRAKMEFLAVMSHELRTPLNAIAGYTQLLTMGLRGPVTAEQVEDLEKIQRSQHHLLGLINDIMNFARLETGHVTVALEHVPVNETLAVIDALTEPQVAAKGITYAHARCDPALSVWADREKTRQILINLVSNAIKFTHPKGSITIDCEAGETVVHFHVRDTGRGIPTDKLEVIFEPFVQVSRPFTREQDGVGLGLAISRDLARMMHGDLKATSTLGVGSQFTLTLPRWQPGAGDPPAER